MKEFLKKIFTKENMKKFFFSFIWLMIVVVIIDAASKWAVVSHFGVDAMNSKVYGEDGGIQIIKNFLYIGGSINPYMSFSLHIFDGITANRIFFIFVSFILSGVLILYYVKCRKSMTNLEKVAISLMIAGAIGNLIDRTFYWPKTVGMNGVIDWIDVTFGDYHYPMFNIADSSLVIGVALLILYFIIDAVKEAIRKSKAGEYKYSPKELEKQKQAKENEADQSK